MYKGGCSKISSHTGENQLAPFVGNCGAAKKLYRAIRRLAKGDEHILITGDFGSGKTYSARCLHAFGPRDKYPFAVLNCAALGYTLDKGDVVGRTQGDGSPATDGLLQRVGEGVLFLDHFTDLAPEYQLLFATILQRGKYKQIGGATDLPFKARVIASANSSILRVVRSGEFNGELFSLFEYSLVQPTLKERRQDIPELLLLFLKEYCEENQLEVPAVPAEIFEPLLEYEWHGNIKELKNCVANLVVMSRNGQLYQDHLPFEVKRNPLDFLEIANLNGAISDVEVFLIRKALRKYAGNQVKAARQLGIPEATLRFKIKKYAIVRE